MNSLHITLVTSFYWNNIFLCKLQKFCCSRKTMSVELYGDILNDFIDTESTSPPKSSSFSDFIWTFLNLLHYTDAGNHVICRENYAKSGSRFFACAFLFMIN